jgi:hypothetical protein
VTSSTVPATQEKRWITQNHIRKIKDAEEDWQRRATAIRDGTKQSMLSLLEERGFVNQIVGSVFEPQYCTSTNEKPALEKTLTTCSLNGASVLTLALILLPLHSTSAIWYHSWLSAGSSSTATDRRFWYSKLHENICIGLTEAAGWRHIENWRSNRPAGSSTVPSEFGTQGQHGEHASTAQITRSRYGEVRRQKGLHTRVGMEKRSCQQQHMVEQSVGCGVYAPHWAGNANRASAGKGDVSLVHHGVRCRG